MWLPIWKEVPFLKSLFPVLIGKNVWANKYLAMEEGDLSTKCLYAAGLQTLWGVAFRNDPQVLSNIVEFVWMIFINGIRSLLLHHNLMLVNQLVKTHKHILIYSGHGPACTVYIFYTIKGPQAVSKHIWNIFRIRCWKLGNWEAARAFLWQGEDDLCFFIHGFPW